MLIDTTSKIVALRIALRTRGILEADEELTKLELEIRSEMIEELARQCSQHEEPKTDDEPTTPTAAESYGGYYWDDETKVRYIDRDRG